MACLLARWVPDTTLLNLHQLLKILRPRTVPVTISSRHRQTLDHPWQRAMDLDRRGASHNHRLTIISPPAAPAPRGRFAPK